VIDRAPGAVACALAALLAVACSGPQRLTGSPPPDDAAIAPEVDTADEEERVYDGQEPSHTELEQEEEVHEDPAALDRLISELTDGDTAAAPSPGESAPADPGEPAIPVAYDNWAQEDDECLARLEELDVRTVKPECDTALVQTPVLLDGPIEGVVIRPRWPRSDGVNAVMDCRLVLALVALAREAKRRGVTEVLFYSTYRPLKKPPDECDKGKAGASCRKARAKYEKALKRKHSQHRRGLAIDIRWFVTEDGDTIDVLEHYERKDKQPPCEDEPQTDEGRLLRDLACALHEQRVFNVMLTPNANKAHHNHFHFDITPDSKWYVIK
jgi:hypothetical protein